MLPSDAQERKAIPVYSGFIKYFPRAIVEIAKLSRKGNDQHNNGPVCQWDRAKSPDELDAMMRHVIEEDWVAVAWRALANLEKKLEKDEEGPDPEVLHIHPTVMFEKIQNSVDSWNALDTCGRMIGIAHGKTMAEARHDWTAKGRTNANNT